MNTIVKTSNALHEAKQINNLKEMLKESAELYKDNIAFKYRENEKIVEIKYDQVQKDVDSLGTAMIDLGLEGKKVAVIGLNSYKWCLTYLGTVCGTGIIVPIDKALPLPEIENILVQSEAEAVFFDGKYVDIMKTIKSNDNSSLKQLVCFDEKVEDNEIMTFSTLIKLGNSLIEQGDTKFINAEIDNKSLSMLLFTSGTTAASKAVMLSHYNICSNIMGISSVIKYYPEDVLLSFLPIHHTLECTVTFLTGLYSGSCIAICQGLKYILHDLVEYHASIFASVPLVLENMYKKISRQVSEAKAARITITNEQILASIGGKLRFALVGAAALGKDVILGFKDLGIRVCQGYGLTETSPVLTAENDKYSCPGSIGYAMPNIQIKIDNPDSFGMGEIIAKGPNIMLGYYNNDEATNEVLKDGWLYTGDLGYVNDDGFLFISGRKKNVIVLKNGKNIFPEELEVLLNNNPLVAESFVYSVPAKDGDFEIRAKIVYNKESIISAHGNISEEEILNILEEHRKEVNKNLPLYKIIRKISITDEPLVKTTTGKIRRNEEIKKIA